MRSLTLLIIFQVSLALNLSSFAQDAFFVEGYTDQSSYLPGETVNFHISSSEGYCQVQIFRLGAKEKLVWSSDSIQGGLHEVPEQAATHGCQWPVSESLMIPHD